ncbi:DUF523 domain-containing protein [Acerihabitans arboris]|uniref:DUF523 domain-containing protein n=1 Tax=Acerihabitans arboris TaxID=2691583 RepID=A0A845SHV3_9GAMM|nr:DUF523 domain-containing protein [Acerihabitans arboris]NDL64733.1 DUF523 domain-containing protein [Acerihabitans arboris]
MDKILISACLAGFNVRYNGSAKTLLHPALQQWRNEGRLVVCCPELAAGFSTPRPPAEITVGRYGDTRVSEGAKVIENTGQDVTERYLLGAYLTLKMAQLHQCRYALLTDGSPSCGSQTIYAGAFNGDTKSGYGVTAQLLHEHGIVVFSHRQIDRLTRRVAARE